MKGVNFKDQTGEHTKPSFMTDDECYSLPTKKTINGNYPVIESVWELTEEDLKLINKSKRIRVGLVSKVQCPMYIHIEKENNK